VFVLKACQNGEFCVLVLPFTFLQQKNPRGGCGAVCLVFCVVLGFVTFLS
jgi:hypothetical protein